MENNNNRRTVKNLKINFPKLAATLIIGVTLVTTGCSQFQKMNDDKNTTSQSITIKTEKLSFNDKVNKLYQEKLREAKELSSRTGYNYNVRDLYNDAFDEVTKQEEQAKEKAQADSKRQARANERTSSGELLTHYYDTLVANDPDNGQKKAVHDRHENYVETGSTVMRSDSEDIEAEKKAQLEDYYANDPQGQIEKSIMDRNAKEQYYEDDPKGREEKKAIDDAKQKEYYEQYREYLETLKIPDSSEQKTKTK